MDFHVKCRCSLAISVLGDGCRYCQPQEYIDRLHDQIKDDDAVRAQLLEALKDLLESYRMEVGIIDADTDECISTELARKAIAAAEG